MSSLKTILVTGVAGFIGFHVANHLLARGVRVVGFDNLNDYYDPTLKQARLDLLIPQNGFSFQKLDLVDAAGVTALFAATKPDVVVHLAAQAGVRYSLTHPHAYTESNITGFLNMLEAARAHPPAHFIYASSSSVYGGNTKLPFAEDDPVDHPISLYAATKKANELMAHTYAHLYGLPCTGLRFFTVYGPWGRPDMALFKFVKAAFEGTPIDVYNHGDMQRDFTYIDDIVDGIVRLIQVPPLKNIPPYQGEAGGGQREGQAPATVYNIGHNHPEPLMELIRLVEVETGRAVTRNMLPLQPGDVPATYADITRLNTATGFTPTTPIAQGVRKFVAWYRDYYMRSR